MGRSFVFEERGGTFLGISKKFVGLWKKLGGSRILLVPSPSAAAAAVGKQINLFLFVTQTNLWVVPLRSPLMLRIETLLHRLA